VDYRKQRDEILVEIHKLETLKEHPGWKKLEEAIHAQIRAQRNSVFQTQINSLDDAFGNCGMLAKTAGLQLTLLLLEQMIDDLKADLEIANEEVKGDNDGRR